jgi:hypothetical protein
MNDTERNLLQAASVIHAAEHIMDSRHRPLSHADRSAEYERACTLLHEAADLLDAAAMDALEAARMALSVAASYVGARHADADIRQIAAAREAIAAALAKAEGR